MSKRKRCGDLFSELINDSKEIKIKSCDGEIIETKLLWGLRNSSDAIYSMFKSIEESDDNYIELDERSDVIKTCLSFIKNTNNLVAWNNENALFYLEMLKFFDKYLLEFYYDVLNYTISKYMKKIEIDNNIKLAFAWRHYNLPLGAAYYASIRAIQMCIGLSSDIKKRRENLKAIANSYDPEASNLVFRDVECSVISFH